MTSDPVAIISEAAAKPVPVSYEAHLFFLILGIVLIFIIVFAARYELRYLAFTKPKPYVKWLSFFSFAVMFALSMVSIFHYLLPFTTLVGLVGLMVVLLLIITPLQFVIRIRSFNELSFKRIEEKVKLMREVTDILDESKRKKFIETDETLAQGGDKPKT